VQNVSGSISSVEDGGQMGGNIYYNYSTVSSGTFGLTGYGTNSVNLVGQSGNIEAVIESGNDICWNILTDSDLNQLEVDQMNYTESGPPIIHPIDSNIVTNSNGTMPITISVPESDLYYGDTNLQGNPPMVHIINETAQWNEWLQASTVDVISPTSGSVSYLVDSSTPSPLTRQANPSLSGDIYIPVTHHSGSSSIISSIKSPPNIDVNESHFENINSSSGHDIHPWADCKDAIEVAAMQVEQCLHNSIEQMQHF